MELKEVLEKISGLTDIESYVLIVCDKTARVSVHKSENVYTVMGLLDCIKSKLSDAIDSLKAPAVAPVEESK